MDNLLTAMRAAFPTLSLADLRPNLQMNECPNWDSMTAVNLIMEIGSACGTELKDFEISDATTLAELAAVIAADGGKP